MTSSPSSEPSTAQSPSKAKTGKAGKLTPMMQQFYELRDSLDKDTVLFFRMGDFYEIFGDDATTIAPKLGLVLTAREKGHGDKIPFCGVPHHSVKGYWQKLISLGYRVAIADQLEDPKEAKARGGKGGKTIVKRGIVKVLSPGAIDDEDALDADKPNYMMAIHQDPASRQWWAVIGDVSTGELRAGAIGDSASIAEVVYAFRPRELLCRKVLLPEVQAQLEGYCRQHRLLFGQLPESVLAQPNRAEDLITSTLGHVPSSLEGPGRLAVGAFLAQISSQLLGLDSFLTLKDLKDSDNLIVDETARRDLELFETVMRREQKGSLYSEINRTLTPLGARRLRDALLRPYASAAPILRRQHAIGFFVDDTSGLLQQLRSSLKGIGDIRRLATTAYLGTIKPGHLSRLRDALSRSMDCGKLLTLSSFGRDAKQSGLCDQLLLARQPLAAIERLLTPEPGALADRLDVINSGIDSFLDDKVKLAMGGEASIAAYEQQLKDETGIQSLKVKRHKSFGLLIEVTKSNVSRVPESFHRRQTMVNGERFQTATLSELDEQLSSALEQAYQQEAQLYQQLLTKLKSFRQDLSDCADAIAELDVMAGLAQRALESGWVAAELTANSADSAAASDSASGSCSSSRTLRLKQARHPVVESLLGPENFVANDIEFDSARRHLLITGPNMAGKSTIMRQTALCVILNQIGSFVPCSEAQLPIIDRVFTRVGASDDLSKGQSTFMVEMVEAAQILRQATPKSLVLLDEVGRGTSSGDGLAIASALLEDLANRVSCFTLFATHYHELLAVSEGFPGVFPMATEVVSSGDAGDEQIKFTHRLVPGGCLNSYGIEVANLAGMPAAVIERAKFYLASQQKHEKEGAVFQDLRRAGAQLKNETVEDAAKGSSHPIETSKLSDKPIVQDPVELSEQQQRSMDVSEMLLALNIDKITPLKALNILAEYQSRLLARKDPESIFDGLVTEGQGEAIL